MFCGCALSFADAPNTHTCPVCLGLPGALPVINARAVHLAIMIGLALGSEIAPRSLFHRKNYFYPDLPKGYQISQYDVPVCSGGALGEVRIHRAHLEEDAAKLNHLGASGRIHGAQGSWVDFNRGGTPLVEIVTEPDVRSPEQAREWLTLLRATLKRLGVSDVNMEEGSLRCDANVSVRPVGTHALGTKTELKNMNSFRYLERGVRAEIERQIALLREGGSVVPETLHYDPASDTLTPLRSKEEAHDYRYFPEPDLVPLLVSPEMIDDARAELPELPAQRAERFERELGLRPDRAHELAFRSERADYFEAALAAAPDGARRRSSSRTGFRRWWSGSAPMPTRRVQCRAGGTRRAGGPRRRAADHPRCRPRGAEPAGGRWRSPGRDRRARGAAGDERWARGSRGAGDRRRPGRRRAGAERQPAGTRSARRRGHARDQGPGRRRRGPAAAARAARRRLTPAQRSRCAGWPATRLLGLRVGGEAADDEADAEQAAAAGGQQRDVEAGERQRAAR